MSEKLLADLVRSRSLLHDTTERGDRRTRRLLRRCRARLMAHIVNMADAAGALGRAVERLNAKNHRGVVSDVERAARHLWVEI